MHGDKYEVRGLWVADEKGNEVVEDGENPFRFFVVEDSHVIPTRYRLEIEKREKS